jgi:hypothetical protein
MSYYMAYFLAEMWYGPAHAQINNLFPSQFQGFACAIFNMSGTIAGTIATSLLSRLYQAYDPKDTEPQNAGYILGAGVLFSYVMCAPFFLLSGYEYKKEILLRKADKIRDSVLEQERNLNFTSNPKSENLNFSTPME